MLELKPNCEKCKKPLLFDSTEAYICSYECTFCHNCVTNEFKFICPNCNGKLEKRPTRIIKPKII